MPKPPDPSDAPIALLGQSASAGYASGPLYVAQSGQKAYQPKADKAAEIAALENAIASASADTALLMAQAEGDAADIIEFQFAMLEDDTFLASAGELIETGLTADQAWVAALNSEIETYEASDDAYFAARASDLGDIRDRVVAALTGSTQASIPKGSVYLGDDITPSAFLSHDWSGGGIVLHKGSATGHVAMLARQRGVPMIVRLGGPGTALADGMPVHLNAEAGSLLLNANAAAKAAFDAAQSAFAAAQAAAADYADKPAMTSDGTAIKLLVNIADPAETETIPIAHVDGVGLMRTEFLYGGTHGLPSEQVQLEAYKKVLIWAGDKPVTIRTVDAGGDKPIAGFTHAEDNPFLGVRGIRLCLEKPNIFKIQIRALLRAATFGNLKVMLPMVAHPDELAAARALFQEVADTLTREDISHTMPPLGIMVEVPSVAITPERFDTADFFSIGSNDLTQYVLAASRDNGALAVLAKADDPAVLALIERVATHGSQSGQEVGLCGDAASDPALIPHLLSVGLRSLSVAAARIGLAKSTIAKVDLQGARP